ncbi:MAG: c-type cytochrome [Oxalobacteraceae bacterium]
MTRAGISHVAGALVLLASGAFTLPAQAQSADGAKLFAQHCAACHQIAADAPPGMGPNLRGVVGRQAGQVKGFAYSAEFKKALAKKSWTADLLDKWLEEPQNVAPGTYMMYKQADPAIRAAIIEYLSTAK